MSAVLGVVDLIKDFARHVHGYRCSICKRFTIYDCGGFYVCAICDTTAEARRTAGAGFPHT